MSEEHLNLIYLNVRRIYHKAIVIFENRANSKLREPSERQCPDKGGSTLHQYTVKGQKYSTTMNFTHYIRGNYSRKNKLKLKDNIEVYKYHTLLFMPR